MINEQSKLTACDIDHQVCNRCEVVKSIDSFYYRDKKKGTRKKECKDCFNEYTKQRKLGNTEFVDDFKIGRKTVDYELPKECVVCGEIKEAHEYHKNGSRRKTTCKKCQKIKTKNYSTIKTYLTINTPFNCRTCDTVICPEDVYIISRRNNKPSTQCKDCYFADVNARKMKRRVKIKESRQVNTPEEETRIREIYRQCKKMNKAAPGVYHVDHIHPLSKGGAHHPDNLQIITAKENRQKSNKIGYIVGEVYE